MSGVDEAEPGAPRYTLDPDRAAAAGPPANSTSATGPPENRPLAPPPVIDTRPYGWVIGIFGLALVIAFSISQFATHGVGTTGIPAGKKLHFFAAPLAASTLNGDANLNPPCTLARHDPRALNVCLLSERAPLVLAFFVTGSDACKQQIDTLQAVSREFPPSQVQFAAVAVDASRSATAALVRSRHWTIPVAYDRDGAVGTSYSVEVCPLIELSTRGGTVADRLLGEHWLSTGALAGRVRALLGR